MLDFCIIGAPKAGTSSLYHWLNEHPALQGSIPKEPHFFMDAGHPSCGEHGLDCHYGELQSYAQHFFPEPQDGRLRFEATTHYFYQTAAREYLSSLDPQPLVVLLLREPGSRVRSSFRFTRDKLGNCEHSLSFDDYVGILLNKATHRLDDYFSSASSLYIAKRELELNKYASWIAWWLERLRADRLELILFEDLKANPEAVVQRLSSRLGIDGSFYDSFVFDQRNKTVPITNRSVHRVARGLASNMPEGAVRRYLKEQYLNWQQKKSADDTNYEWGLQALRQYFAEANRRLAEHYGLDLRQWEVDGEARPDEGSGSNPGGQHG